MWSSPDYTFYTTGFLNSDKTRFHSSIFCFFSSLCYDGWKGALIIPEGWEINDCLWSRPGPLTTLETKHVICNCWSKNPHSAVAGQKNGKWGGEYSAKVNGIFVCSPLFNRGFFFIFALFFHFVLIHCNGFQTGKWKCCSCPLFQWQRPGNRAIFYHQG